jgi:beta-galactosidase
LALGLGPDYDMAPGAGVVLQIIPKTGASLVVGLFTTLSLAAGQQDADQASDVRLAAGVKAVWDLDKAYREKSPTRERICLNGLWRWQPAAPNPDKVPKDRWGYFKVPGFWPGTTSYIQEDCQTLHAHPSWKGTDLRGITAAWYQREITIPAGWAGRRIAVAADYVNSFAVVYVDGAKAGEMRFPAGEVDVTAKCCPGNKHVISLLVHALPLKGVLVSHTDTNSAREVKGAVDRRSLCGDVHLVSTSATARIIDVKIDTSVRKGQIAVSAALDQLDPKADYTLHAEIRDQDQVVRKLASKPFKATDLQAGRITVADNWMPDKLWDTHTPGNQFSVKVSLRDKDGNVKDVSRPERFGFREFWILGRDFYLNGTRIYLSAVPLDNAQVGARTATYEGARETMKRLRSFGINFVYTHNYGCEPGSHVSFAEILRAADDAGMLVALSQPHFAHYDWKRPTSTRRAWFHRSPASAPRTFITAIRGNLHSSPVEPSRSATVSSPGVRRGTWSSASWSPGNLSQPRK